MEREERLRKLAEAMEELPEDQREALICRDLQGMTIEEIAVRMERGEKAVAGLLYQARRHLRELLFQEYLEGQE